ncbi:MAG: hypothetical protein JRH20_29020 [Deltaproteobacteria bacterium]|nr:hypothetical protein [Deltaproteobacteria bacterium]
MTGGKAPPGRPILLRDNAQVAIISGGFKLIWTPRAAVMELYRLGQEAPIRELSAAFPQLTQELRTKLRYSPLRVVPPIAVVDF